MKEIICSNCGEICYGTYSEGGILFALCEDCYNKLYLSSDNEGKYEDEELYFFYFL